MTYHENENGVFGPYEQRFHAEMKKCLIQKGLPLRVTMTLDFWVGYFRELHDKGETAIPVDPTEPVMIRPHYWLAIPIQIEGVPRKTQIVEVFLSGHTGDHVWMDA